MAIRIKEDMCIIHKKYAVMFFHTHTREVSTVLKMALRISKYMRIIHVQYVVRFFQTYALLNSKGDNNITNGY